MEGYPGRGSAGRDAIVGRARELALLDGALKSAQPGRVVVVEGVAGIGKTTVWEAGTRLAEASGRWILRARPAAAEISLPFAVLGDLLDPVLEDALPALPGPQRAALETALLRRRSDAPTDRLAVAKAVVGVLRDRSARGPTLVAIDDVQWLDPASAEVLEFAIRRLGDVPLSFLIARRTTGPTGLPLGLDDAAARGRLSVVTVGPMPVDDLDLLLRSTVELRLPRPRLIELQRRTDGNPFFALEIARAARLSGGDDLRIPDSVGGLLRIRLEALTPAGHDTIVLAAAAEHPTADLLARAARHGDGRDRGPSSATPDGIAEAIREGFLIRDGDRIRFTHPLLASVAVEAAMPWERQAAHARLAAAVRDPEARARHLALATDDPDPEVAAILDDAADLAARRGAPESAAELGEHAARLTPADRSADRRRRMSDAAERHITSGDPTRGRELLRQLVDDAPPGPEHAGYLSRLADAGGIDLEESIRMGEVALAEAGEGPALRAQILTTLGVFTWITGRLTESADYVREAAIEAEKAGDDELVAITLGEMCHVDVVLGRPLDETAMARALALERQLTTLPSYLRPSFQLGVLRLYTDDLDGARPLIEAELERVEAAGDESARVGVLFRLADLELRRGDWASAERHAGQAVAVAPQAGIEQEQGVALMIHGLVQAHLGFLDVARRAGEEALRFTERTKDQVILVRAKAVLGLIELSRDDPAAALRWLTPAREDLQALGIGELSITQVANNEIEALIALDRLDEAERSIGWVADKGRPANRAWHAVIAARGAAMVASARGDTLAARRHLEAAFAAHERLPQPFELGRTFLAAGTIERRARRRGEARLRLTRALEIFESLAARCYVEKTVAELARLPGRRPGAGDVTETERRVAELVVRGLSNKEVAARLFITVRTVEANLSSLYAKLGVRSRTELAAAFSVDPSPGTARDADAPD